MNYNFGKDATYGDIYKPAMELETREQADEWWEAAHSSLVEHWDKSEAEADEIISHNLGYWTGYYSDEVAERVFKLFEHRKVSHPIFGKSRPTAEEAFGAGKNLAS